MTKKRFSVVFLILLVFAATACTLIACQEAGESPISQLVITTQPKTTYYWGDSFDASNATITVIYENGTTKSVPMDISMLSAFDPNVLGEQILTVRYGDAVTYLKVNVITPPVYSLDINSTTHKTEYVVDEEFNVKDLTMLVTYSNGRTSTVAVEESMVSGFDSSTAGSKQIVIMYGGKTCNMAVEIVNKSVMEMQLIPPERRLYIVGDTLEFDGGSIFVSYNDNTTQRLSLTGLFETGALSILVAEEVDTTLTHKQSNCTVRLYYRGHEFAYAVTVDDLKATSLMVSKDPPDQIMGSEKFNFKEGRVYVVYNNGTDGNYGFEDSQVSLDLEGCDINSVGTYEMVITVAGANLSYRFKVVAPVPESFTVTPDRASYYQNDEIDITKWTYSITLNNGNKQRLNGETVFAVTEDMFVGNVQTDIDNFKTGEHTYFFSLRASSGETLETSVKVSVLKKEISSMEIINDGKTIYSEMDTFSLENTYLQVTYNNGDKGGIVSVSESMLRADANGTAFDAYAFLVSAGSTRRTEKRVYVEYTDSVYDSTYTSFYTVMVVSRAKSIALYGDMPRTDYVLNEEFDNSDWQVLVTYSNDTTATYSGSNGALDGEEWTFSFGYYGEEKTSFDEVGTYVATLYYGGRDVCLHYNLYISNEIVDIYANRAHAGFVTEGTSPDLTGMELYTIRENGDRETVAVTSAMIGSYTAPSYRSGDSNYSSAYVNANVCAALAYDKGVWREEYAKFFIDNGEGYVEAEEEYDVDKEYRINIADGVRNEWASMRFNFFENASGVRALDTYEEGKEYFINNTYLLPITYQGHMLFVPLTVKPKTVLQIDVETYKAEYVVGDVDWDIAQLRFVAHYDNGTASVITGTRTASNPQITENAGILSYDMNGLTYQTEIGKMVNGTFITRSFADMKADFLAALSEGNDLFYTEESVVRVYDPVADGYVLSSAFTVYCYSELIESISILVGRYSSGVFTVFDDQTVYLNERSELFDDAFVLNENDDRVSFVENAFLFVKSSSEENYYSIQEAKDLSSSFYVSDISANDPHQTLTIGFLHKEATVALEIRQNVIHSMTVVLPNGSLSVIENMAIDPSDIEIYANYVDADGNMFDDGEGGTEYLSYKIDFRQVECTGYSKTMNWNFEEDETEKNTTVTLSYGGLSQGIALSVLPKTLVGIKITTMPYKIQYVEQTDTAITYEGGRVSLSYDNGTTVTLALDRGDISKNTAEFTTAIAAGTELDGGEQRSCRIYISFTYRGVTKDTFYNVIIVDRKYVEVRYDASFGYDNKLTCEYGAGPSVLPDPVITYYEKYTDIAPTALEPGAANTRGYYFVQYRDESGHLSETWPTAVGTYTVRYTYFYDDGYNGDEYNNAFCDETITLEIVKKKIAIRINEITVQYGDVLTGDNKNAFALLTNNGEKYWGMTAVENGRATGIAYCYDDTDETILKNVSFEIKDKGSDGSLTDRTFATISRDGQTKIAINAPVGSYVIVPKITLWEDSNYELSEIIERTQGSLVVEKRNVVIVAESAQKTYGENDPVFSFRIYEQKDVERIFGDNTLTASMLFDQESSIVDPLVPIGNRTGIFYMFDGSNYEGDGAFEVGNTSVIFRDNTVGEYHLARASSDTNNVYDEHVIHEGAASTMSNYEITYIENVMNINRATLIVKGNDLVKYFGTSNFISGGSQGSMVFFADERYSAKNNDNFELLFADYFNDGGSVTFYSAANDGRYETEIVGYGDGWYALFKNVRIYSDSDCSHLFADYQYLAFTRNGITYAGYYSLMPLEAQVGTYYVEIDVNNIDEGVNTGLKNYSVGTEGGYAFTFDVRQTYVRVNTESFVVSGQGTLKDQKNIAGGRRVYSYFESAGLEIRLIDRETYDNDVNEEYKNAILSITYLDENGKSVGYKLRDDRLLSEFSFVRTDKFTSGIDTGIHTIVVDNYGSNVGNGYVCDFDITLSSFRNDTSYVKYFYNVWSNRLDLPVLNTSFDSNAYLVVLPEYVDILPNQPDVTYDDYGIPQLSDEYERRAYKDMSFSTYRSLDGATYELTDADGITYMLTDNATGKTLGEEEILNVGSYSGSIRFSFFETENKNYLYIGDTAVLDAASEVYILTYVFDTSYEGDNANNALIYTAEFSYSVTPAQISLRVNEQTVEYDGNGKTVRVIITDGDVYTGDNLSLTFDVDVLYNGETNVQHFTGIPVSLYELRGVTVTETGAMTIVNAGAYTVVVNSAGDGNYEITSSLAGTISISPINVPIFIQSDGDDPLAINRDYQAGTKGINPFSTKWTYNIDGTMDYTYKTDGLPYCSIVREYYIGTQKYTTNTAFDPSGRLIVSTAQEDGTYPKTVKRNEEGEVIGYPITYSINNSTFNNYTIIFVKKTGSTYNALPEGERYELIINPSIVMVHNFTKLNYKEYDGNPAIVLGTDSALTIIGDYKSDPIVRSGLYFNFYRPEYSMKVGSYQYITDVAGGFKAEENITDAGVLHVKMTYTDNNGNQNYDLRFADDEVCYTDSEGKHSDIGIYTIRQASVTFDLKNVRAPWQNKQFDGYGLLNPEDIAYTNNASVLPIYGNDPVDDLTQMFYKFVIRRYGAYGSTPTTSSVITATDAQITATAYNGTPFNIGFYWYDLRGVFYNTTSEKYETFESYDATASDWLSWNYTYSVQEPTSSSVSYYDCDGIYVIDPRDVYVAFNAKDLANGILDVDADVENAPVLQSSVYNFKITYDGKVYRAGSEASGFVGEEGKTYCDFIKRINDASDTSFTYALYTYDEKTEKFKNVRNIVNLREYYDGNISGLTDIFAGSYGTNEIQVQSSNQVIEANVNNLIAVNPNFNIVNRAIRFSVRARNINVSVSLVRMSDPTLAEMVFGTVFDGTTDGLYFRFGLNDSDYYSAYDANLTDLQTIVTQIINNSVGELSLRNNDSNQTVRFRIANIKGLSAARWYSVVENGKTYTYVKVLDSFITDSAYTKPSSLPANQYDEFNEAIPRYITAGADLSSDITRYNVNVTGTDFTVTRREVTITGIKRVYFNKETNDYVFKVEDIDEDVANEAIAFPSGTGHCMKDYIQDNTSIAENVGIWTTANKSYYVRILLSEFRINNSNYIVALNSEGRNVNIADISAWNVAQPVYINSYVYIPLEIVKASVTVNYNVSGTIAYGDRITMEPSINNTEIDYVGLPTLNPLGIYYYQDRSTGETKSEENIINTGKFDSDNQAISLQSEQNTFKRDVVAVMLFEDMIARIAQTSVSDGEQQLSLSDYVSSTPTFDNYEIVWGVVRFTIVKKRVKISMYVIEENYSLNNTYFSALWSERDSLYYSDGTYGDDLRLAYGVEIGRFSINTTTYTSLGDQIVAILGASYENGMYKYQNVSYSSLLEFMTAICKYKIYLYSEGNDISATSGGDVRYVGLYGLESNNFDIVFARSGIMLYPEMIGMGKYTDTQGKYVNLIPNTEATNNDVEINFTTNRITGLSMLFRLNFTGFVEENAVQYVDTNKKDDYEKSNYLGMGYERNVYLTYIPEYSATRVTASRPLQTGDVITVTLTVEETFYDGRDAGFVRMFVSPYFEINIKKEGSSTKGYRETTANKKDTVLTLSDDSVSEGYGEYLSRDNATYYLRKQSEEMAMEGFFDIINIKARLIPENYDTRKFEIIVYENSFGTLLVGFDGTKNYMRIVYNTYYILVSNNLDSQGQIMRYDGAEFYRFAAIDPGDSSMSSSEQYYEAIGNGYILTSDTSFVQGKQYYTKTIVSLPQEITSPTQYSNVYTNYSESRITEELVSVFDGNNHSFSIFLDKVGAFTNVVKEAPSAPIVSTEPPDEEHPEYGAITTTSYYERFSADRLLTLRVLVDNTTYIFTYIGEPYSYTYNYSKMEFENLDDYDVETVSYKFYTAGMFAEAGKTGISVSNVKALINKYSTQNRLISTVSNQGASYIANVVFWPMGAEDSDIMYVTNEKTALTIFELMDTIGSVSISGGEDAFAAYNVDFNEEKKVVNVTSTVTDIANHENAVISIDPGMYTITYVSEYNYRANDIEHVATLSTNVIRILVTENTCKQLTLYDRSDEDNIRTFNINSSSPKTFSNGMFMTNDMKNDMTGHTGLTYVFDSVSFSTDSGDIWLYYKTTNLAFYDLANKNEDIFNALGVALRISKRSSGTTARVIVSQQKPLDDGSRYSSWRGEETNISFGITDEIINILKIDVGTKGDYNSGNIDMSGYNDTVITFRLYQHNTNTNLTHLVFEEYIRTGFGSFFGESSDGGSISHEDIENSIFEPGIAFYTGIRLEDATIRLLDLYKGIPVETGMDFVSYDVVASSDVLMTGTYYSGDTVLTGTGTISTGLTENGKVYIVSDKYNVPYAYSGNSVSIRFKLNTENSDGGFRFYFGMSTPYLLDIIATDVDLTPRRQRGLLIEYNASNDALLFYYYKYNTFYLSQTILGASQKVFFNDGEEHTMTVFIDTHTIYGATSGENVLSEDNYLARVIIDKSYIVNNDQTNTTYYHEWDVYIPVGNNFTGYTNSNWSLSTDDEQNKDLMFLKGIYYMGFEVFEDSALEVLDCIAFEQTDTIF